jgi:hypothetical protein
MHYYEEFYRKHGLWEEMTKGMINIDEYHKSKEYQSLNNIEKAAIDKEIEEFNKAIKGQIAFYPYGSQELMGDEKLLKKINDVAEDYIKKLVDGNATGTGE